MGEVIELNERNLDRAAGEAIDDAVDEFGVSAAVVAFQIPDGQGVVRHYGDRVQALGLLALTMGGIILDWLLETEEEEDDS